MPNSNKTRQMKKPCPLRIPILGLSFTFGKNPLVSDFVFRYISISLVVCLCSSVLTANEMIDYLKRYEGRWVGDFTIRSTATGYSETFQVEQRYWWEDGQLHAVSVSDTKRGMQTSKSRAFIQNGALRFEVLQDESVERYNGVLHEGGIVWFPAEAERATDYRMKESFAQKDGVQWLHTDGFDSYLFEGGLAHLVYRGRLVKQPDE